MKKKGFTLIELLAVIVILAIIALIATPMVLNTIDEAKKGSFEQSLNNIIKSAELYQAKQQLNNPITDCRYFSFGNDVDEITTRDSKLYYPINELQVKGSLPTEGELEICSNSITMNASDGTYTGIYDGKKLNVIQGEFITVSISVSDENNWTKNKTVTIKGKSEGTELQYQLNQTNGEWITYTESFTVDSNATIYARLWDGKNEISHAYKEITKIDSVRPNAVVTANVGNGVSTTSNVTMNATSTTNSISGYTYQWYQVPKYSNDSTWSTISTYSGFTLTPMEENDIEFVRASMTKTEGTENEWKMIQFPRYTYTAGNTYILHAKVRTVSSDNASYNVRHAAKVNDHSCKGCIYWPYSLGWWVEYNVERTFLDEGIDPGVEISTGELKVTDTVSTMSLVLDYRDIWIEEVENSSNATVSNNLGDLLEGETSKTLTVSGTQDAYYVAKITSGTGLVSYSNKFHVVIK